MMTMDFPTVDEVPVDLDCLIEPHDCDDPDSTETL